MDKKIRALLFTIIYYACIIGLFFLLEKLAPSDMCNPGAGMVFLIFILPLLITGIIIRKLYVIRQGKKEYKASLLIDILAIILLMIFLFH